MADRFRRASLIIDNTEGEQNSVKSQENMGSTFTVRESTECEQRTLAPMTGTGHQQQDAVVYSEAQAECDVLGLFQLHSPGLSGSLFLT
jgi:hypothetical protein